MPREFVTRLAHTLEEASAHTSSAGAGTSPAGLPDPEVLLDVAMTALGRALDPEGRERGGAFDLLAADAFATWAAEAGLDRDDPDAWLQEMMGRFAQGPRGP